MSFDDPFDDNFSSDMDDIKDLLDEVPKDIRSGLPDLVLHHEGNNTFINNFVQITNKLRRDIQHIKKYISTTLGVKTRLLGDQLEIIARITKTQLKTAMEDYVATYITCSNCGKPDTYLRRKHKKFELDCLACGYQEIISE